MCTLSNSVLRFCFQNIVYIAKVEVFLNFKEYYLNLEYGQKYVLYLQSMPNTKQSGFLNFVCIVHFDLFVESKEKTLGKPIVGEITYITCRTSTIGPVKCP